MPKKQLSHVDVKGRAQMVNVGQKPDSERSAIAMGEIVLQVETINLIQENLIKKGDVLAIAQIAGIQAAKRTYELIPLCHPIQLTHIDVEMEIDCDLPGIKIRSDVKCTGKTGVEMEALTAVSVAALTVYDMIKAVDRKGKIQNIRLIEKHGGKSGDFVSE